MAKLNVDEIEANGTNSNVKVTTKGTDGSCEIKAATNDATLQLNCSVQTHGVKLKAPANTAGQNYTMILPDNQIAANKLLKVKSVTNNVGQLEYADEPSQSLASLNADNITSGTLPAARVPSLLTASQGAAFELVSKQTVGTNSPSEISFTGLEDNTMYRVIAQHIGLNAVDYLYMYWLDSNNAMQSGIIYTEVYYYSSSANYNNRILYSTSGNFVRFNGGYSQFRGDTYAVIADFNTKAGNNWMIINAMQPGVRYRYYTSYASFDSSSSSKRIHGIKFKGDSASTTFNENSEIVLYKYRES